AVNLQMVRAGIFRRRDESDSLGVERIAHVDDRIAVAEHMPDKNMAFVQYDLHAIEPAPLIATRDKADVLGGGAGREAGHAIATIKLRVRTDGARPGIMPNRAPQSCWR